MPVARAQWPELDTYKTETGVWNPTPVSVFDATHTPTPSSSEALPAELKANQMYAGLEALMRQGLFKCMYSSLFCLKQDKEQFYVENTAQWGVIGYV